MEDFLNGCLDLNGAAKRGSMMFDSCLFWGHLRGTTLFVLFFPRIYVLCINCFYKYTVLNSMSFRLDHFLFIFFLRSGFLCYLGDGPVAS